MKAYNKTCDIPCTKIEGAKRLRASQYDENQQKTAEDAGRDEIGYLTNSVTVRL